MNINRIFLWAQARMLRNRLVKQAQRLKNPRYVIALLVGALYFIFLFAGPSSNARNNRGPGSALPPEAEVFAALGMVALVTFWWLRGGYQKALAFTPVESHFLFPAPVHRRQLIHFKLLNSQLRIVLSIIFFALIIGRGPLPWAMRAVGLWTLITTFQLHQFGASLVREGAAQKGSRRRSILPIAVVTILVGIVVITAGSALPALRSAANPADFFEAFARVFESPIAAIALLPFSLVIGPTLASSPAEWWTALPGALALLVLHYVWLIRTDAAFEEAAADAGAKISAQLEAFRAGRRVVPSDTAQKVASRRTWVPLSPAGHPAAALFWKNLVSVSRTLRPTTLLVIVLGALAVFAAMIAASGTVARAADAMVVICLIYAGFSFLFGSMTVRNDLRQDLARLEILKTLPVGGRGLVAAEIASATITISASQVAILLLTLAFAPFGENAAGYLPQLWAGISVFFLAMPLLNGLLITLHNAFALLFPGWSRVGLERPGGAEFMGQFIITAIGTLMGAALALLPPLLFAAIVAGSAESLYGRYAFVPAVLAFFVALAAELALAIQWLGHVYDDLDAVAAGVLKS